MLFVGIGILFAIVFHIVLCNSALCILVHDYLHDISSLNVTFSVGIDFIHILHDGNLTVLS